MEERVEAGPSGRTLREAIKGNKWKFIVILAYALFVFIAPLWSLTPYAQKLSQASMQTFVTKDEDNFFKQYITLLQQQNVSQAYILLDPTVAASTTTSSLEVLSIHFASTTSQMRVVGWYWKTFSGATWGGQPEHWTTYDATYEITNNDPNYPYLLVELTAQNSGDGLKMIGVHAQPEEVLFGTTPGFTTADGVFLLFALLMPLFILCTAFRYLMKARNPRWLMFLIILFLSIYFNISSPNPSAIDPLITFNVTIGVFESLQSFWAFAIPLPLGAIYYWFAREKYESASSETETVSTEVHHTGKHE